VAFALFAVTSLALVLTLRWVPPPASAVMLHQRAVDGIDYAYRWVPLREIAPTMALAVVAAEDQKFPDHFGFDLDAIRMALADGARDGPLRGASTISQQVAKNLFLWRGRSWLRKGLEAWFTVLIEVAWPKRRILEVYLNVAELGPGLYGVEAASHRFFATRARDLNANQAALLAAVLPNPVRLRADAPSDYVRRRQRWILWQMERLGGRAFLAPILP
jgi:monofunctional biosynthetic peptidoglycan transglycosylase